MYAWRFKITGVASRHLLSSRQWLSSWSPLLVLGEERSSSVQVVKPDLNLKRILEPERVKQQLIARGWKEDSVSNIPFHQLALAPDYLKWLTQKMDMVQQQKTDLSKDISKLGREGGSSELKSTLFEKMREANSKMKIISSDYEEIERWVYPKLLQLPAPLHPSAPATKSNILWSSKACASLSTKCVNNANHQKWPIFGEGALAQLELELPSRWHQFRAQEEESGALGDSTLLSAPDFVKSVVIAGCGGQWQDEREELSLFEKGQPFSDRAGGQGMHLAGGASLYSLVSFLSKNLVTKSQVLPHAFIIQGRHYCPDENNPKIIRQRNQINYTSFSGAESSIDFSFEMAVDRLLCAFYEELGLPARLVEVKASKLGSGERKKLLAQVWFPTLQDFVDVGNIALYGDYISSRLMLKEMPVNQPMKNLHCFGGCVVDISLLARCLIDQKSYIY